MSKRKKDADVITYNLRINVEPGMAQREYESILVDMACTLLGNLGRTEYEEVGDHWQQLRRKTLVSNGERK